MKGQMIRIYWCGMIKRLGSVERGSLGNLPTYNKKHTTLLKTAIRGLSFHDTFKGESTVRVYCLLRSITYWLSGELPTSLHWPMGLREHLSQ